MRFSRKGQSVIEYVIVFVLVGLGIAIMGPYAIRSIHGHMKAWEDAVDDSITDPLPDVDTSNLPVPKCACSPMLPHGCGLGGCGQLSMRYQRDCRPLGCADDQISCAEDANCCTPPVPVQECGGCQSDGSCCTPWTASGSGSCRGEEGCPIGMVASTRQCGGGVGTQTSCQPSSTCVFQCTGNLPDHSKACLDAEVGLRRDKDWELVANCVPSVKCQAVCDTAQCFHYNPTTQACDPGVCCMDNGSCDMPPDGHEDCSCTDCINDPRCCQMSPMVNARCVCSANCNGANGCVCGRPIVTVDTDCPASQIPFGGECLWVRTGGHSIGTPTTTVSQATASGWHCEGNITNPGGSTCHSINFQAKVFCEPTMCQMSTAVNARCVCSANCNGANGCVCGRPVVTVDANCPMGAPIGGECTWVLTGGHSIGTPTTTVSQATASGWHCEGNITNPGGSTCHSVNFQARVFCR